MPALDANAMRRRGLAAAPIVAAIVAAAVVPLLNSDTVFIGQITVVAVYGVALMGLNVAMGYTGLQNLATGAIFGIGAIAAAGLDERATERLRSGRHITIVPSESLGRLLYSIAGGALIATVLGLLLLLPALRLGRSATLMVSLYMAVAFPVFIGLERLSSITGGTAGFKDVRQLVLLSDVNGDAVAKVQQEYWIVLALAVIVFLLVRRLVRSHWGRAFIAVRDDEVSAAAMGVDPIRTKVVSLAVLSVCAAVAGAFYVHIRAGTADFGPVSGGIFDISLAIFFFAALVVGGPATLVGPLAGAVVVGLFQQFSGAHDIDPVWRDSIFGALLLLSVIGAPGGIGGNLRRLSARIGERLALPASLPATPARPTLPAVAAHAGLEARGVVVRFGGNMALAGISLQATAGRVHALVGANGSGKTTLLNAISGLVECADGSILVAGRVMAGRPVTRARRGVGRTFQTPRVAVRLSALENVLMGAFARYHSGWRGLYLTPWTRAREDTALHEEARRLLGAVGLANRVDVEADALTHGERRLLEVARALIGEPQLLLLDEPAAGLAHDELGELAALVRAARDSGCAVVLVEHNLAFVRSVSDDCTVLERGRVIGQGTPAVVLDQPAVIESFVGTAAA